MARTVLIGKERHAEVILKVLEEDEQGRPKTVVIVRSNDTVDLKGGERFISAFIHESANRKRIKA